MDEELKRGLKAWEDGVLKENLENNGEQMLEFKTDSGIPVNRIYTPWTWSSVASTILRI